jgi:putative chitinase
MNRKVFFDTMRGATAPDGDKMFPSFSADQVAGINNLLDVWEKHFAGDPEKWLAYNLGTAYHETAATMQPITERGPVSYFNKYEPGTSIGKVLGNTVKGDGYKFRGEGHVQNTGRRNASFATARLNKEFNLGIDLVANPGQRGDPFVSAMSLFLGNKEGWWTGRKLGDYITSTKADFINARRVVNGVDKAELIAHYAGQFLAAVVAASKAAPAPVPATPTPTPAPAPVPTPAPVAPTPTPAAPEPTGWAALFLAIAKLFGGAK